MRKFIEQAKLERAHKENPSARVEIKRQGLEVGKRVRYRVETGMVGTTQYYREHI